jgi:hypothetical protein
MTKVKLTLLSFSNNLHTYLDGHGATEHPYV